MQCATLDDSTLQHPLIVVAHPDDEAIGCSFLLQRCSAASIVFCTSGASYANTDWKAFGSVSLYTAIREQEARNSLACASPTEDVHFLRFEDGALHHSIPDLYRELCRLILKLTPGCVVTHVCEGGHPDHDVCAIVCGMAASSMNIGCLQMPLYGHHGKHFLLQRFRPAIQESYRLAPTREEILIKRKMLAAYASQDHALRDIRTDVSEIFAPFTLTESKGFLQDLAHYAVGGKPGSFVLDSISRSLDQR